MVRFFKSRKLGTANSAWEAKNSGDYIYHPKDTSKLRDFIERERKALEKPRKSK